MKRLPQPSRCSKAGHLCSQDRETYTYDSVGNLQSFAYPNGVATNYNYDTLNRLTQVGAVAQSTTIASYTYTLGSAGNRLTVAELSGRNVVYGYDSLYRLTSEAITADPHGKNGTVAYTYDAVGNRQQMTSTLNPIPAGLFNYTANDQLSIDTYDNNGNTIASAGIQNTYDLENHLISHGGVTIVYDGDGNRVSETIGGVTTNYLVDTQNPTGYAQVVDEVQNGAVVRTYSYGLERISETQPINSTLTTSFYGYDGHGSVRFLTNSAAAVTDSYDYDAFGNLINQAGSTPNVYLFAGEQYDPALGLYYNRARYLNTTTGRFWGMDTGDGEDESPLSLHKFAFGQDDPVDNTDRSGNEIDEVVGSFAVAATINAMPTLQINATVGTNGDYPDIHDLIAEKARSYVGSRRWLQVPIPSAHTVVTWDETCNIFVYDVLTEVGANPPKIFRPGTVRASLYELAFHRLYDTPPIAHEWADPGFYVPFWEIVPGGPADAKAGDVIAEQHPNGGGHSGIVVGKAQTASASAVGLNFGKIVVNDWGFRSATYNGTGKAKDAVVRRFVGISDLGIGSGS